jgi:hypothetical protein
LLAGWVASLAFLALPLAGVVSAYVWLTRPKKSSPSAVGRAGAREMTSTLAKKDNVQ